MNIFISHAGEDGIIAQEIQKWIHRAFKGGIKTFCSTGGLQPGDDWKDKILAELRRGDVALVLCSEKGLSKIWVGFEAGAMWEKGARVIPVCFHGVSKSSLPEPFRFFQGINIEYESDQNELIDILAETAGFDKTIIEKDKLGISPQEIKSSSDTPDFRVFISAGSCGNRVAGFTRVAILKGQNHSKESIYLSSGISFESKGGTHNFLAILDDFITGAPYYSQEVKPGRSVTRLINPKHLLDPQYKFGRAAFVDEIGRCYYSTQEQVDQTIEDLKKEKWSPDED